MSLHRTSYVAPSEEVLLFGASNIGKGIGLFTQTVVETDPRWTSLPFHRSWLSKQAEELLDFFQRGFVSPKGGFYDLDISGRPINKGQEAYPIYVSARAVHCFAIGASLGRPGSLDTVDHGIDFLWNRHRDERNGGYFWSVGEADVTDSSKQGYGHAFVLLAASSAKAVGHPMADAILADVTEVIERHFWDPLAGAIREEFTDSWSQLNGGSYRGQNSNMHLTEALMAAYEVTGDRHYLGRARQIADKLIRGIAGSADWRVPEHFDKNWEIDKSYSHPAEVFRPVGMIPGHWMEWSRLILQLWVLTGKADDWMPEAAMGLFKQAIDKGWDDRNRGLFYTLDWDNNPIKRLKLWWPLCEGVGAAHFLNSLFPDPTWEQHYRLLWDTISASFIDRKNGGWHEELTEQMAPSHELFAGKGDIYHALQACLIPLYPATGSILKAIAS